MLWLPDVFMSAASFRCLKNRSTSLLLFFRLCPVPCGHEARGGVSSLPPIAFFADAKFTLGRMLRNSNSDEIVECVLEMRKNFSLCRIDEDKSKHKEPSIICSMGLKYQS